MKKHNERAFPCTDNMQAHKGMTLLDYFAGQALAGMMANPDPWASHRQLAMISYNLAEAMLAEKEMREAVK